MLAGRPRMHIDRAKLARAPPRKEARTPYGLFLMCWLGINLVSGSPSAL